MKRGFALLLCAAAVWASPAAADVSTGSISSIAGLHGSVISAPALRSAIGAMSCPGNGTCAPAGAFLAALQSVEAGSIPDIVADLATALVAGGTADLELRAGQVTAGGPLATFAQARYGLTAPQMATIFAAAGAVVNNTGTPVVTVAGSLSAYLDQVPSIAPATLTAGTGAQINITAFGGLACGSTCQQLALGDPLTATLNYTGGTAKPRVMAVLGTQSQPSITLDAAAVFQKVTASAIPGNDDATYTSIVKTTTANGASGSAGFFEASDLAGGSGTFMEGIDARCVLRSNGVNGAGGGTCGNVAVSATDAGVTAFGNLIGLEAGFYFYAGDQPTFQTFNPNHEVSAFLASNFGSSRADAAFVVNANNGSPFRTGLLVLGSGIGAGKGVDDTAFATRGGMPVGINLAASTFATAAIVSTGFVVGPAGDVAGHSFQEVLMTPPSSSTACTAGQFTDDVNYHYVCTAAAHWRRVALSDF